MIAAESETWRLVRAALARLPIDRLVLAVHDASFPAAADEDVGRGTPYSRAAGDFFAFVAALGFDGVQLGPQGKTSLVNPSPYDGALAARSHLLAPLGPLVDQPGLAGLVDARGLARAVAQRPPGSAARAAHAHAWQAIKGALHIAHRRFSANPLAFPALAARAASYFAENADWLQADALFEILSGVHGSDDFTRWPALDRHLWWPRGDGHAAAAARRGQLLREHGDVAAFNDFCQLLLATLHEQRRRDLRRLGLVLLADVQIGLAPRDRWRHEGSFLPGYAIGAPPSRTNPEGQAWGYPVLDPHGYWPTEARAPDAAPALQMFDQRITHLLADFDGLRIDHPHGLVCPWIYRTDGDAAADPIAAVQAGARLFASPDLPDHPELARYAIPGRGDLAPAAAGRPRYAEDWVRALDEAQLDRYALLFDRVIAAARARGVPRANLCAEVLSTCPYPVARVLARHGLGRVRVVQKADPDDPRDPYRSADAAPADWITLGTHDTRPIAVVTDEWRAGNGARAHAWARYLTDRLLPAARADQRAAFVTGLEASPRRLLTALTADLFVGPARHVSLFFADLFGLRDTYNTPGTVGDHNWTLRVPADFATSYPRARAAGTALDLPAALALALRAHARGAAGESADLAAALERA